MKNIFKILHKNKGFTLIEAIVAIGVISVGFVGSLVLISKSSSQASILKDRVVAAHLAEEGIEVVYNVRDTNWIKGLSWLINIPDTVSGIVDYDSGSIDISDSSEARRCLNWDGNTYRHAVSPAYSCTTTFKRHIEITTKTETIAGTNINYIEVKSIVSWKEKSLDKSLTVIDHLYDWK
ncbi:MAG: type II secretion system protein [Patescibacteria group bacterium]